MESDKILKRYILITSMNFPSGGAGATYLNLFCRGLKLNGCNVSVYLLKGFAFGNYVYKGPRKNITEDDVPYTYLGFKQRPDNVLLKLCDELISFIRLIMFLFTLIPDRKKINLFVYSSEIQFNIPISFFTKIFRIKTSKFVAEIIDKSEFKGSFFRQLKRYGYNFNFKYLNVIADKLVVFSYYLKNEYLKLGFKENNIIVQPNLTDFNYWDSPESEIKYDIGYSGAPYLKDGLYDLFQAISLLNKKQTKVTLLVIGDATFGESLIPPLKIECEKLGISEQVSFTGLVESLSVKKYLSECRILAITRPSTVQTKAGFPTKLGEYYATRKPVLATNFGDMTKYFTDGEDIVMAECGDPESISEKILWMLQNTEDLDRISRKGYEKAKMLLEYKNSVSRMIESVNSSQAYK
jgi:glycosyltransferase involved in cell wall biosynthesis